MPFWIGFTLLLTVLMVSIAMTDLHVSSHVASDVAMKALFNGSLCRGLSLVSVHPSKKKSSGYQMLVSVPNTAFLDTN